MNRHKRVEFSDGDVSFNHDPDFSAKSTDWYKFFLLTKAENFLADRVIAYLTLHQLLDFLIICRNSLKVGGLLRIGETDWLHPLKSYLLHAERFGPQHRFDIRSLTNTLASVGLIPVPIEFFDESGQIHEFDGNFSRHGIIKRSSRVDARFHNPALRFSSLIVDGIKCSEARGSEHGFKNPIFAIGDSHVRFLSGCDEGIYEWPQGQFAIEFDGYSSLFRGRHIGPALAWNLNRYNSHNASREKIEGLLTSSISPGSSLLFSFGEIDCRAHCCEQAERRGCSISEVVDGVVEQYLIFLERVFQAGFHPAVWGVPATTWHAETLDQNNPICGTFEQRQHAVMRFNLKMQAECIKRNFPFIGVFDRVHSPSGSVKHEYFCDFLHLSQAARPYLHDLMPDGKYPDPPMRF